MSSLSMNLRNYKCDNGDNHVLNGILFEIYFGSHGEFWSLQLKDYFFDEVMSLRKYSDYAKSFGFIRTILNQYKDVVLYLIPENDAKLDVDITVRNKNVMNFLGEEEAYSIISSITVDGKNITELVRNKFSQSGSDLVTAVANVTKALKDALVLHPNIPLQGNVTFEKNEDEDLFDFHLYKS